MNKIIQERNDRHEFYRGINFDGVDTDAVAAQLEPLSNSDVNERFAAFDSIFADTEKQISVSGLLGDALVAAKSRGINIDADTIDSAVATVDSILKTVNFDSIGGVQGAEIVASFIKLNLYSVLSSEVPFVGDIADLTPISGSKDNVKFEVIGIEPVVTKGMGEIAEGESISALNAGSVFASSERSGTQAFVKDTLEYTFNAKAQANDGTNTAIEKGVNEVVVGGSIFINDFDVSSSENTATRVAVVGGITYTATFDYAAGTIVLKLSDNIADGTKLLFVAGLSGDELSKISGVIKSDAKGYPYVALTYSIDTQVNTLKLRQMLQATGLNVQSNDLTIALNKTSEEIKFAKINKSLVVAKDFGDTVDLGAADESTLAEKYRHAVVRVDEAREDIATKSGITNRVVLVGGSGMVKLFSGLATEGNKVTKYQGDENSFRLLGTLADGTECYFNPQHDTKYPVADGVHTIFVIGNPSDVTKKAAISGVGLAFMPDDLGKDIDSNQTTRIMGKIVVSTNKDARARELVRAIKVKF